MKYYENACWKIKSGKIFSFPYYQTKKIIFQTFPGWKTTKHFLYVSRLRKNHVETTKCGTRVRFRRPFTPTSLFASMLPRKGLGGRPKLTFTPDTGNPRYAIDAKQGCWALVRMNWLLLRSCVFYNDIDPAPAPAPAPAVLC